MRKFLTIRNVHIVAETYGDEKHLVWQAERILEKIQLLLQAHPDNINSATLCWSTHAEDEKDNLSVTMK